MPVAWKRITDELNESLAELEFGEPVRWIYNPLVYARRPFDQFVRRFGKGKKEAIFLGMNPGPFGMAQTGVPFGEIAHVRDWLQINGRVDKPEAEHPKRPILGFDCQRSEVSGRRLWGFFQEHYPEPMDFFDRFFVVNFCPLVFMEEGGKNRTPDKLPAEERDALFEICNLALCRIVDRLDPQMVIGIGKFATDRAKIALEGRDLKIGTVLHPSPASPAANRGWAEAASGQLDALGIQLP